MSTTTNPLYTCILCNIGVPSSDRASHIATTHTNTTLSARGPAGVMMTDARWVTRNWQLVTSQSTATGVTAPTAPSLLASAAMVLGTSDKLLLSARSTNIASGGILSSHAVAKMKEAIVQGLGMDFDPNVFQVSFASWYMSTTGSTKQSSMGSFTLMPNPDTNPNGTPKDVKWSEIFDIWAKLGPRIGVDELTPRKYFTAEGNLDMFISIYKNHEAFSSYLTNGTKQSNDAMLSPNIWYYSLPGVAEHLGTLHLTETDRQAIKVRQDNAIVEEDATIHPYSMRFDPSNAAVNSQPPPPSHTQSRTARNLATKGLIAALRGA